MIKATGLICAFVFTCGVVVAQNTNSSTTTTTQRQRTTNTNRSKPPADVIAKPVPKKTPAAPAEQAPGSEGVLAAFNSLLDGIRHADVGEVMGAYWNNPRLNLFNYNGSVTKGWDQVRKNRESSYPEIKDVKLEVRDVNVTMLGRDAALVTCLWTQSQTYKGVPETVSGRMTLAFRRVGTTWKAIHLHSSPDNPNPAVVPPSERATPSPSPSPSPTPQ